MQSLTTTFSEKQKTSEAKFNEKWQNLDKKMENRQTAKMENKPTKRAKMQSKRCIKARLQYLQRSL